MNWYDLKPFLQGVTEEGRVRFSIPMSPDEDGLVGRQCPNEECYPRYFKIAPREDADEDSTVEPNTESPSILYCPYCGREDGFQQFTTDDQREWILSMVKRDVVRNIQGVFERSFRRSRIFRVKRGSLPVLRRYQEEKLKRITSCESCGGTYAVYGVATRCPRCGAGSLQHHLRRSADITRTMLKMTRIMAEQGGSEAEYKHLCNCLEDCVSLFEGFLRKLYGEALTATLTREDSQKKVAGLGNVFQNPTRAEKTLRSELAWELFAVTDPADRDFLEWQFAKRHVITHNMGLVDEKYLTQVRSRQRAGQDVEVETEDVSRLLDVVEAVLARAAQELPATR
jgi:predicted RNA-binding Zn-ribbon protein involved in translation (DUF1610 family)